MTEYRLDSLLEKMNDFPVPEEGFLYVASEKELEETLGGREIKEKSFGGIVRNDTALCTVFCR